MATTAPIKEKIRGITITDYAEMAMTRYGKAVNEDRALPDFRDGMKPVQRKLLWAMYKLGLWSRLPKPVKSARIIGDTLGKYHPHSDTACYGALVTMANQVLPTVDGTGNWGNILRDPAAAMRYCFTEDTRVMTADGLWTFKDLAKRSGVYKKSGASVQFVQPIPGRDAKNHYTTHLICAGEHETVRVTTVDDCQVQCTPNEPFLVVTPKGHVWKRADELSVTDWVCMKRGTDPETVLGSDHYQIDNTAIVLGYLVGDGYLNLNQNHIGFNQVDQEVFDDFCNAWKLSDFADYKFAVTKRKPSSYGRKTYNQFYCNNVKAINTFSKTYGLHQGDSYDRCVPKWIWKQNHSVVGEFLSALFESDGSVFNAVGGRGSSGIYYNSMSTQLMEDMRLLLRVYFGIFAGPILDNNRFIISGSDNIQRFKDAIGFRSSRKQGALKVESNGKSNKDCIPYADQLGFSRGYAATQRETFRRKVESREFSSKAAKVIYDTDYKYVQIESVEPAGKAWVYDLTVPQNNSFTANGFIVHNTNAKMSVYGDAFFDPYYTPVLDLLPNFDDTENEPLVLFAPLPNVLVNGSYGIGVGTTCYVPTFSVESVAEATVRALQLRERQLTIGPKVCAKLLKFVTESGGAVDQEHFAEDILNYYRTGEGSVVFTSRWTWDSKRHAMVFTAYAAIDIMKTVARVAEFTEVTEVIDESHEKGGIKYVVFVIALRKLENSLLTTAKKKIVAAFSSKENFKTNITERVLLEGKRDVQNRSTTVPKIIDDWVTWRLGIEVRASQYQIGITDKKIRHTELLILAVVNRSLIIKLLDSDMDDVQMEAELARQLKILPSEAKIIFDLRVRQLKKLETKILTTTLNEQRAARAVLESRVAKPGPWVIKNIQALVNKMKGK